MRFTIAINTKAREQLICEYGLFDKVGALQHTVPGRFLLSGLYNPSEVQIPFQETRPLGGGLEKAEGWMLYLQLIPSFYD